MAVAGLVVGADSASSAAAAGASAWLSPAAGGRRVAFDGLEFRVINTGDANTTSTSAMAQAQTMPSPPALPFTAPDGSPWTMAPPLEMQRTCENCGKEMETVWSLPGYNCRSCGRSEISTDATTLQVVHPGEKQ